MRLILVKAVPRVIVKRFVEIFLKVVFVIAFIAAAVVGLFYF